MRVQAKTWISSTKFRSTSDIGFNTFFLDLYTSMCHISYIRYLYTSCLIMLPLLVHEGESKRNATFVIRDNIFLNGIIRNLLSGVKPRTLFMFNDLFLFYFLRYIIEWADMKMCTSKQRTVIELFAADGFPFFGPVKETLRRKHWGGKLLQRIDYIISQKSFYRAGTHSLIPSLKRWWLCSEGGMCNCDV